MPQAEALAAANKRISNILRKNDSPVPDTVDESLFEDDAERALAERVQQVSAQVAPMAGNADYTAILKTLSQLRDPVDRFFDDVMVMADDAAVRGNRLALLRSLADEFLRVADVSLLQA